MRENYLNCKLNDARYMSTNYLLLRTNLQWEDVVLPAATAEPIQEILAWLKTSPSDREQVFGQQSYPGYQVLFDGEADETKTLTAALPKVLANNLPSVINLVR
jgi:hypothetical protein